MVEPLMDQSDFRRFARRVIAAAFFVAALPFAPAPASAMDGTGQIAVGGTLRSFAIHVPDGPAPAGGFPLILAFHGGGMQGEGMRRLTGLDRMADARRFIAVYPDGVDGHWNDGRSTIRNPQDDVRFVAVLLDQLARAHPVDQGRIYATGLSNGALFAERIGCDLSRRIAGIAPVAGTLPVDMSGCRPARRVAVLQIGGTADPIMPFNGGPVADFGGRGEGGSVLSVARTAAFWAQANGCGGAGAPEALRPLRPVLDPTRVLRTRYGCPAASRVTVLTVVGGGHTWPGGPQYAPVLVVGRASHQFDATGAMVDFFLTLPRR
ncbi:esterase [Azorhizobium oxalatiphilum]|uniref:Esterase n=1 Tax=Azorhizobium oxalatiphilum TaxID=980631 RepID=A0A917FGC1_9HYPH|nr:hypothetical protein [Azorhizobium oxalatiphilum]GGF74891.1 esterase [Azorhizobium oxalatiphilum]